MAHNYLGVIYARQGETDLAIAAYKKALENLLYINPQNSYYNLGLAYLGKKEYDKAVENFQEALALVPDFTAAYNGLGQSYEGLNKTREAKRAYSKAIEFAPQFAEGHLNLGILQLKTGEKKEAINSFREVIRLAPDSDLAEEAKLYLKRLK
jgi:tetratricopeptide (TPR) repeat protein